MIAQSPPGIRDYISRAALRCDRKPLRRWIQPRPEGNMAIAGATKMPTFIQGAARFRRSWDSFYIWALVREQQSNEASVG